MSNGKVFSVWHYPFCCSPERILLAKFETEKQAIRFAESRPSTDGIYVRDADGRCVWDWDCYTGHPQYPLEDR